MEVVELWYALHGNYGQPAEYKAQLLLPAGACALGVVALVSGAVAAGLLLVAGGIGVGVGCGGSRRLRRMRGPSGRGR